MPPSRPYRNTLSQAGLTVLELIITVAVIGILTAFAVPSYNNYQRRAYVSEGLGLARPGQVQVSEDVMQGRYLSVANMAQSQIFPYGQFTLVSVNPSAMVKNVVRYRTMLAITYTTLLDPGRVNEYAVLMVGAIENTKLKWTCLSGDAAEGELAFMRDIGAPVGMPLPTRWAPSHCQ